MALGEWRHRRHVRPEGTFSQWHPEVPHPPRVFIEQWEKNYWIVTRVDPLTNILITKGRGKTISGPFPDITSAKAAFEVMQAFGALDSYAYPP